MERSISSRQTMAQLKDSVKNVMGGIVQVLEVEEGPPTGHDISYQVVGHNYEQLGVLADQILDQLHLYSELHNINSDFEMGKPELFIDVNRRKAAHYGLNTSMIANAIRNAINGEEIAQFRVGDDEYPINIRYPEAFRRDLNQLSQLEVVHEGKRIPLGAVADIRVRSGPGVIKRLDLKKTVQVWGDFKEGVQNKEEVRSKIAAWMQAFPTPEGYAVERGEGQKMQDDATAFLGKAFMIAIFLIFMVLVIQFNSLAQPLIILVAVLLSIGGVLWGFALTGQTFVLITSGIGVISLAGVVVNNAIVLIDYTNLRIAMGLPLREAVVSAGKTRLRPVLLTAITTVLGLVPMALGISFDFHSFSWQIGSESSEWWKSMAWTIIYGLSFATVMTLVIVPNLLYVNYKIAKKWEDWRRKPSIQDSF
jgi:multidrug efflux pump